MHEHVLSTFVVSFPSQFEYLVKLTVSVRCTPMARPATAATSDPAVASGASAADVSDDITASGVKFKISMLGVPVPVESAVVASRDFTWEVPVELISSDAWAQQMAVDEESHVAVTLAGASAPVVLLPLRLASLMGRERSNTTQIAVESSALGQTPVLMSSIFVTITRDSDMLSPALMDRLNPLAITIVRCPVLRSSVITSLVCLRRSAPAACPSRQCRTSSCALPASRHTSSEPLQPS